MTVYSLLATFIPQTGLESTDTLEWMAQHPSWTPYVQRWGLFSAFTTPVFIVLAIWLTAATTACSWERTRRAKRLWDAHGVVTESMVARLRAHPQVVVPAGTGSLERLAVAMRRSGLSVRQGPRLVVGASGRLGLLGSPIFHWSLVLFFVVVALGQLTRSEGQIGVPVGGTRLEQAASYGTLDTGALFMGHSGLALSVPRIQTTNVVGGVDREAAPQVVLFKDGRVVRDQLVYPNNPLRFGAFIVHRGPFGFVLPVSLEASGNKVVGSDVELLIDTEEGAATGTSPTSVILEGPRGSLEVTLTLVAERGREGATILATKRAMPVRVEAVGASVFTTVTAPGTVELSDGLVLRIGAVKNYARIGVVYDWSVTWIYVLLVTATAGLSLAMMAPHRVVRVLLVEGESGALLHAIVEHRRGDPLFVQRMTEVLQDACVETDAAV